MFTMKEMEKLGERFDFSLMSENSMREFHRAKKDWEVRALRQEKPNDIYTKIQGSYGTATADYVKMAMEFLSEGGI